MLEQKLAYCLKIDWLSRIIFISSFIFIFLIKGSVTVFSSDDLKTEKHFLISYYGNSPHAVGEKEKLMFLKHHW